MSRNLWKNGNDNMAHINVRMITPGSVAEDLRLSAQDCPFCQNDGGLDVLQVPHSLGKWSVTCPNCHAKGPIKDTVEDAITFWNVKRGDLIIE